VQDEEDATLGFNVLKKLVLNLGRGGGCMWDIDICDMHNVPNFNKNDKLKSNSDIENIKWKTKLHIQNHKDNHDSPNH
jgi:hypothetical protein